MESCSVLLTKVRACTICEKYLPLGPRPILQLDPKARILIAGQAPGKKVHETGILFNDASGKRLREWMGITSDVFYNAEQIAILPMGFCYPGTGKSGDLPPRKECEPAWRKQLLQYLNQLELTIVLGKYAQAYHFPDRHTSLTTLVKSWRDFWPNQIPLPHPSPRNTPWLRQNPWFEAELIPILQNRIAEILCYLV